MFKPYLFHLILISLLLYSCSRRHVPEKTVSKTTVTETNPSEVIIKNPPSAVKKHVHQPTKKDIIPNVIVVNDAAAHKSVDGRLYYDLLGHRYWKNYKNGKYYLFNQAMYSNDAFKPPHK